MLIGPPDSVYVNATIDIINKTTLLINWNTSEPCIHHYIITINSNNTHNESRTTKTLI